MPGVVGKGHIREDAYLNILDKQKNNLTVNQVENQSKLPSQDTNPFRRARTTEVRTLVECYDIFKRILEVATIEDGTNYPIDFTLEYPPSEAILPCFSAKLIKREPLQLKGTREMGPRFMSEYEDPDYPGQITQEYLIRQQNTIEITVWAKTNKIANERAEWFETKYWEYLWALQWCGTAHPIQFLGRKEDVYKEVRDQPVYGAPMIIQVITGKITRVRVTAIRKIAISLGLLIE